jgi:hypothetical protein
MDILIIYVIFVDIQTSAEFALAISGMSLTSLFGDPIRALEAR